MGNPLKLVDLSVCPSRKRATVLQAIGGYVNTGIVIIQGLLLIPLYLHYIGAHTYGIWLASGGMLGMLGLMNFGISSLVIQRIAKAYAQQNFSQVAAYSINGAVIYLGICLLYAVAGWIASLWLADILGVTGGDAELLSQCFQIAVLAMVLGTFNEFLRSFCQALLRPVVSLVSMATGRIFGIAVTVWMLFNDFGLWSIPIGILISESVIFVLNLVYAFGLFLKLEATMSLDRDIIKEYMRTSPVLFMARVGNTISKESDPLLITIFLSPELTTAYMVTRRAADIVFRLLSVIVGSTMGSFSHLAGGGDDEKTSGVAKTLLTLSFSISAIGFATYVGANHAFMSLWVGDVFVLNQDVILFIALGFFARTFRGILGQMLYGLGDFIYPSIIILSEGVVRLVLAVWLLNMLGVVGVPLAFTLSCLISILPMGSRLISRLGTGLYLSVIVRLLLSVAVLFGGAVSLINMGISIDSWGEFILLLGGILIVFLMLYMSINWASCRGFYRDVFT